MALANTRYDKKAKMRALRQALVIRYRLRPIRISELFRRED